MSLWRDSGKTIRFLGVDGRSALGIPLVIVHISWWTFALAVGIMLLFFILERFSYTMPNAFRKVRSMLAGKIRYGVAPWRKKGYRSF